MNPLLDSLGALAAALSGFCALGLAMDRHYEDSFGRGATPGRWLRWFQGGGSVALLLSLWACVEQRGVGQGLVLWCGVLTASAIVVALVLSYAPRRVTGLLAGAGVVAALAWVAGLV